MRTTSPLILALVLAGCPTAPSDEEPTPAPSTVREQPLVCGDVEPSVEPSAIGFRVTTEHYALDLAVGEDEARTLGRMAETAWGSFDSYFLAEVDLDGERFEAFLDPDEAAWADRIAADGLEVPWGAGGYFHSATGRAYLYRQPTVYFTRQLFVHELGHQFHRSARTSGNLPRWYVEGIAEFVARHDWDGECLRLGVQPLLTFEDLPADAVGDLDAEPLELDRWVDEDDFPGRPLMLELVRFFETHTERAPDWLAVRDAFDLGDGVDADGFASLLGLDSLGDIESDFDAFVRADPERMEPVWLEWLHRTPTSVRGWSLGGTLSVARNKALPGSLSVTAESPAVVGGAPGLLVAWDSADDYTVLLLGADGALSRWHRVGGQLTWTDVTSLDPPGDAPVDLAITGWSDGLVHVVVDGAALDVEIAATPAAGLAVYDTDVIFDDLVLEAP